MQTIIECQKGLPEPQKKFDEVPSKEALEALLKKPVESCSEIGAQVIPVEYHAFVCALHCAFVDHRPFVFSPDMIWLLISQGFANHVNCNAEEMRHYFVAHEGKKEIRVRRDHFIKGCQENTWEDVFEEFSVRIKQHVGAPNYNQIIARFSTTGPIEKAANEIVLMDTLKSYFKYVFETRCGIPQVIVEGTVADWELLLSKTKSLGEKYKIEWWTDTLLPIIEKIGESLNGRKDTAFWGDIYKWHSVSGTPYFNGWISTFFPYINNGGELELNKALLQGNRKLTAPQLPIGLSQTYFIWEYLGTNYDMEFIAGFSSFSQDKKIKAIRPNIGWAVCEQ